MNSVRNAALDALNRGLHALLKAQRRDGAWCDFNIPPMGESDAWVTAHVGLRLATLPDNLSQLVPAKSLQQATSFLYACSRNGWGYNERSPVDADSTAQGLLFLQAVGDNAPDHLPELLLGFQQRDGGFSTFKSRSPNSLGTSWC